MRSRKPEGKTVRLVAVQRKQQLRRAVFLGVLLQVMRSVHWDERHHVLAPKIFELARLCQYHREMWGTIIVGLTNVLAPYRHRAGRPLGRKPTLILALSSWRSVWAFWAQDASRHPLRLGAKAMLCRSDAADVYRWLCHERHPLIWVCCVRKSSR